MTPDIIDLSRCAYRGNLNAAMRACRYSAATQALRVEVSQISRELIQFFPLFVPSDKMCIVWKSFQIKCVLSGKVSGSLHEIFCKFVFLRI